MKEEAALGLCGTLFMCKGSPRVFVATMEYQSGGTFPIVTATTIINQQTHPACLLLP
jgi:hypothetical protein